MSNIITKSDGNWMNSAIKGGRHYKGLEYLRAALPMAVYNAGIHASGDDKFWIGNVLNGKFKGQSRASVWQHRFEKYHQGDKTLYTLLSIQPSAKTSLHTIQAQAVALAIESRWIEDNLI